MIGIKKSNTNYRGVSKMTRNRPSPYQAYFTFAGKQKYLGAYKTPEEAQLKRIEFIDNLK